jgi:transketolase
LDNLEQQCVNTIRMLSIDMVEKANSGHPGMPLGAAPMAYVLWSKFLKHNPSNPDWHNRDRFILSAGHGSALLYSLLHLTGYDLSLDELKEFRQWGSKTPGHPEYRDTVGVEMTTGPLGQGFATGVGMAAAERFLAARFNKADCKLIDHYTYAIVSDGDLMEGVSAEAASIAGHLGLGKMIYLYDDNRITIEGSTDLSFSEDVGGRFEAHGWHVVRDVDGNNLADIEQAVIKGQQQTDKPSLIMVRTNIGFGSPKQDSEDSHGAPLGSDAMRLTKESYNWPQDKTFFVPDEVKSEFRNSVKRGEEFESSWQDAFSKYKLAHAELASEYNQFLSGSLPNGWDEALPNFEQGSAVATRSAAGKVLNALASKIPNLMGGSADLGPSNKTIIDDGGDALAANPLGRNFRFGVREHAMGCMVNGMALHGGVIPFAATFFVFADYMRPAIRLASIMKTPSIFVFTHDSIGLGEDGPTHQPIEHLASLRAMPELVVFRPADANESKTAWKFALQHQGPTALVLSRQNLEVVTANDDPALKGAYTVFESDSKPDLIMMSTGSELTATLAAGKFLHENGQSIRVVSMPSWELFEKQSASYKESILPATTEKRLAVEAASSFGWHKWVGSSGTTITLDRFGASAPGDRLMAEFGFNVESIIEKAQQILKS